MMNITLPQLKSRLETTEAIIEQLELSGDVAITRLITLAQIELDALSVNLPEFTGKTNQLLLQIHAESISVALEKIVQDALAYYSIIEQPKGTNEPPIGPLYAQQLIDQLRSSHSSLMIIKDELHHHLNDKK